MVTRSRVGVTVTSSIRGHTPFGHRSLPPSPGARRANVHGMTDNPTGPATVGPELASVDDVDDDTLRRRIAAGRLRTPMAKALRARLEAEAVKLSQAQRSNEQANEDQSSDKRE
jgi:hypothetical protein